MSERLPLVIRDAQEEDYPLIYSSYLKSYCRQYIRHNGGTDVVSPRSFFTAFHRVMEKLLATRRVLVACPEETPEVICGWCVGDTLSGNIVVIDYMFCKADFRGMGIGRMLYEAMGGSPKARVAFTHWCPQARGLLEKRCAGYQFIPHFVLEDWSQ